MPYPYDPFDLKEEVQEPDPTLAQWLLIGVLHGIPALFVVYVLIHILWTWVFEGSPKLPDI